MPTMFFSRCFSSALKSKQAKFMIEAFPELVITDLSESHQIPL